MRSIKIAAGFVVLLFYVALIAANTGPKIVVTGTLSRAMAIGAETTGWMIQLDSETTIDGKPYDTAGLRGKVLLLNFFASW